MSTACSKEELCSHIGHLRTENAMLVEGLFNSQAREETMKERIAALKAEFAKAQPRVCVWTPAEGYADLKVWRVGCNGSDDNGYGRFCQHCGGKIEIKEVAP